MNLAEVIADHENFNGDLVVFAQKIDGRFINTSEAVLLELTDEERDMKPIEVAKRKCAGFSYFCEMFMIKEMMEEFDNIEPKKNLIEKIDIIIRYIEFDT